MVLYEISCGCTEAAPYARLRKGSALKNNNKITLSGLEPNTETLFNMFPGKIRPDLSWIFAGMKRDESCIEHVRCRCRGSRRFQMLLGHVFLDRISVSNLKKSYLHVFDSGSIVIFLAYQGRESLEILLMGECNSIRSR